MKARLTIGANHVGFAGRELVDAFGPLGQSPSSIHPLVVLGLVVVAPDSQLLGDPDGHVLVHPGDGLERVDSRHDREVVLVRDEGAAHVGGGGKAAVVVGRVVLLLLRLNDGRRRRLHLCLLRRQQRGSGTGRGGLGKSHGIGIGRAVRVVVGIEPTVGSRVGGSALAYPHGHGGVLVVSVLIKFAFCRKFRNADEVVHVSKRVKPRSSAKDKEKEHKSW